MAMADRITKMIQLPGAVVCDECFAQVPMGHAVMHLIWHQSQVPPADGETDYP
jgi:hypothetical protein